MIYWFIGLMLACGGGEAPPEAAPELATTVVEIRRAQGTLSLAGELRPWQQVELRARLPAYVRERRVDVGDRVAAKDLLVSLSAPDRVAERAGAEADLGSAKSKLARLEVAAKGEGVVAALELEEARGTVQSLEAQLRALTQLESELYIRAPFPGVVTQRGADVGALVGPGSADALLTLAETERLRLQIAVPEAYAGAAVPGTSIGFRLVRGAQTETRTAIISRTSGVIDTATRTVHVELDVDNTEGDLLPGSYVDVLWPLDTGVDFAWIPATALVRNTEGTWVFAVRDSALVRVDVDEVQREGALVAVRGQLGAGDKVVTRGSEDLVEGPLP